MSESSTVKIDLESAAVIEAEIDENGRCSLELLDPEVGAYGSGLRVGQTVEGVDRRYRVEEIGGRIEYYPGPSRHGNYVVARFSRA
jgi:hypothetical protein